MERDRKGDRLHEPDRLPQSESVTVHRVETLKRVATTTPCRRGPGLQNILFTIEKCQFVKPS
jgi:hypothetical protein